MKKFALSLLVVALSLLVLGFWLSWHQPGQGWHKDNVETVASAPKAAGDTIRVLTWNISYAQGLGSDGTSYQPVSADTMISRLDRMAALIIRENADIVLLQEVDFDAKRSHYMDQLAYLAAKCGFGFRAYSLSWNVRYLPYPLFPFSAQWGRIKSGAGVLSRFPITQSTSYFYSKPAENSFFYNWFYPARFRQEVDIIVNNIPYRVYNSHLEAFNATTRMRQAEQLAVAMQQHKGNILVSGGDLNSIPGHHRKLFSSLSGDIHAYYKEDSTLSFLERLPNFKEVIPDDSMSSTAVDHFTFPANAPDHRLDYLFVPVRFKVLGARVIRTGILSDHLPVTATILRDTTSF
jgi:endonuclease/exonuclease/phosphatase family metal-dependent hydrolase